MSADAILELKGIVKKFAGVIAVNEVDMNLKKGEILALIGENGAGKSTLMKILSGVHAPDAGEIFLNGEPVSLTSPKSAYEHGIGIVYQELNDIGKLTVAENLFIGRLPVKEKTKTVDYKTLYADSEEVLKTVGLSIPPTKEMDSLSVAEKQMVEIAKILSKKIDILILDEPTAALNNSEIELLFGHLRDLRDMGKSIIYISHRLDEVFEISDRVHVLRDGRTVGVKVTAETDKNELISMMVGRELSQMYPKENIEPGENVLEVKDVKIEDMDEFSFDLRRGEILGLYGLLGSKQTEIVESLMGIKKVLSGSIKVNGREVRINSPKTAKKHGIVYIPSERKNDGLFLILSVKENILISIYDRISRFSFINPARERGAAKQWIDSLNIKCPGEDVEVNSLSGGNQQKVVLAKCLAADPDIIIMNEPTRGVDVGAKVEIYNIMQDLCRRGMAIIMISSEMPEILGMTDRILTVTDRGISAEFDRAEFDQKKILYNAIGGN